MSIATIISNMITATSNGNVPWKTDDITLSEENRTYTLTANTDVGAYIIHVDLTEVTLNDHDGDPLSAPYTNQTNIDSIRDAIASYKTSAKSDAIDAIDTYFAGLV